jgi:hypothetical protein
MGVACALVSDFWRRNVSVCEWQRQQADATALVRILRRMADPALHWRQQYLRIVPRIATDQSATMGMTDDQFQDFSVCSMYSCSCASVYSGGGFDGGW